MRAMNKLVMYCLSATLMLSMAIFTGCGDDDDDDGPTALPLEGTLWTETKYVSTGCTDAADNENSTSTCTSTDCYTLVLSGGTMTFYDLEDGSSSTSTAAYTISGNQLTVTSTDFSLVATFSISGSTLTVSFTEPGDTCNVTVTYVGVAAG